MPPKEALKKATPQVIRLPISEASLCFVPENAVEGYQERIETGIHWTLIEQAAGYHRHRCGNEDLPRVTFSEALKNKRETSVFRGFLDEDRNSTLTLEDQWELLLPITLWDTEKFANEEGKICFQSTNYITDDIMKLCKKAVRLGNREILKNDLKMVELLRINNSKMTSLDDGINEFQNLVTLILCGNYINELDATLIPPGVRSLELQANALTDLNHFAEHLPVNLLYLGLSRNLLTDDSVEGIGTLSHNLVVLDLSNNDIYRLEPLLNALIMLPSLASLSLAGNPCSVSMGYARTALMRLPRLKWLDSREILSTDRSVEPFEPHPDDLRSAYFNFTIFRVMSAPQPPKPDKGAVTTFHVELELPLLDSTRRNFLMFRRNESLTEMLPPPEDEEWPVCKIPSHPIESKVIGKLGAKLQDNESSSHESDIYNHLTSKNSREIRHFTTFESNKVQWNKVMNFQEPAIRIFCPDLVALRNTFRTVVTLRLIYSVTVTSKPGKSDKKSVLSLKIPGEQRVTLATIKCALKQPDWSQQSQHFHWDDSLGTQDAVHWGDGDLSVIQYSQAPVKISKGKQETDVGYAVGIGNIWRFPYLCYSNGGGAGYATVVLNIIAIVYFSAIMSYPILYIYHSFSFPLPWQSCDNSWNTEKCIEVWADAASQLFYSLGPGWGGLVAMASFNKFHYKNLRSSIIIPLVNSGTSIWAGFVVFSVLGFLSERAGVPVGQVAKAGPGLAFVTYPAAVSMMPASNFWAIIFFVMLFFLGIDTMFVTIESIIAGLLDEFPKLRSRKRLITIMICVALFCCSIICNTEGGLHIIGLLDSHVALACVPVVCTMEIVASVYTYGSKKLNRDVLFMTGEPLARIWLILWRYIIPVILLVITVYTMREISSIPGLCITLASVILIPIHAAKVLYQTEGSFIKRIQTSCRPSNEWGPSDPDTHLLWLSLNKNQNSNLVSLKEITKNQTPHCNELE
ncbi:hypothetical protein K1T71_002397 [Dendrolimus kikuchii]|uniref:Uncharacterized protein n=1 Tax=Dendrolimus kikuchii TaxID=765133 RepID=A0ACC1DCX5_9NEOP|nr:hypothetical protein K1T71_002397 [Dendrolimus kikuchii]